MAYELITFEFQTELHARWAIFFSDMGIPWTYEPAAFTTARGVTFTPTFWLPRECFWFHAQESGVEDPSWWGDFAAAVAGPGHSAYPEDDIASDDEVALDEEWQGRAFLATGPIPEWICFGDSLAEGPWRNHETCGMETYADALYQWTLCPQCGLFGAEYCGYADRLPCACAGRQESLGGASARQLLQAYREARHEGLTTHGGRVSFTGLSPQTGAAEANRLCVRSCRSIGDQLREAGAGAYTEEHADMLCEACPGFVCSLCSQRPAASAGIPCWVCQAVPVLTQSRARRLLNDLAAEVGRKLKQPLRVIHPVINDAMGIRYRDQEGVSRGEFRELLVAGQGGGQAEEGEEVGALSLVSDGEAAVAEEPGDRPLDLPTVSAEPLARLDARAGDTRDDSAFAQPGQVVGGEVCLVRAELDRPAPAWPAAGADGGYASDQRLEGLAVVGVCSGHGDGQGDAPRLGQHVQFAALLAAIDRVRPGQRTPFSPAPRRRRRSRRSSRARPGH